MKLNLTYICPPRSFEFNVTIKAPNQTITNTSPNSGPPSGEFPPATSGELCKIL